MSLRSSQTWKAWGLAAGAALIASAGCSSGWPGRPIVWTSAVKQEQQVVHQPVASQPQAVRQQTAQSPEPVLPVTSDAQLTLFGETPDRARIPFQARTAAPMKQHTIGGEGADFDVRVSPDGKSLVFASTRHSPQPDLYLKSIDGQAVTQLTSDAAADVQPCFSPNGRRIAFASNRAGNWDIWLLNLENGQCSQITYSPAQEVHPSFAPDGKRMAYCALNERSGQWELWTLQLDQPGSRRMIGSGLYPQWSPRGDSILYQRARQRGGRWFSIWKVDLENGEPKFPQELAASSEMALIEPTWSSDGLWIAYGTARLGSTSSGPDTAPPSADTSNAPQHEAGPVQKQNRQQANAAPETTRGDIWIMQADGGEPMQMTDGSGVHFGPAWSPEGRVYFSSRQNGSENIWSVRAGGTADLPTAQEAAPAEAVGTANHAAAARGG